MAALSIVLLALLSLLGGCADRIVLLSYQSPQPAATLQPKLLILTFNDRRGTEGDGDLYRVGGIYGGYGNRLAKVMLNEPWPPRLQSALVAEFRSVGVDAAPGDRAPEGRVAWLDGDIRNFSTESRWSRYADVSGVVRLHQPDGQVLREKIIKGSGSGYDLNNFDENVLQKILNEAFREFVQRVANDPDIRAALASLASGQ